MITETRAPRRRRAHARLWLRCALRDERGKEKERGRRKAHILSDSYACAEGSSGQRLQRHICGLQASVATTAVYTSERSFKRLDVTVRTNG